MSDQPVEIRLHQPNGDLTVLQFPAGSARLQTVALHPGPWYFLWDVMRLPDGREVTIREGRIEPRLPLLEFRVSDRLN